MLDLGRATTEEGAKKGLVLAIPSCVFRIGFSRIRGECFLGRVEGTIDIVVKTKANESSHDLFAPHRKVVMSEFNGKVGMGGDFNNGERRHDAAIGKKEEGRDRKNQMLDGVIVALIPYKGKACLHIKMKEPYIGKYNTWKYNKQGNK